MMVIMQLNISGICRSMIKPNFPLIIQRFSTAKPVSNLAVLRKKTGFAFNLCKKALDACDNDLNKAELWLKEESIKFGHKKSLQVQSRRACEGLVGLHIDSSLNRGILLELNCETDFVAKNEKFREMVARLTRKFVTIDVPTSNEPIVKYSLKSSDMETSEIKDQMSAAILQLGENIKLARALIFQGQPKDVQIFGYSHASGNFIADIDQVSLGKYGALIAMREIEPSPEKEVPKEKPTIIEPSMDVVNPKSEVVKDEDIDNDNDTEEMYKEEIQLPDTIEGIGRILCQHIIGLNPKTLTKSSQQIEMEERLKKDGFDGQIEVDSLIDQKLLINDSMTVRESLRVKNLEIIDFVRFECAEKFEENEQ